MATKLIEGQEAHGIMTIDGIFVPYTDRVEPVDCQGGLGIVTIYWGIGYDAVTDARKAIMLTEQGLDIPPGQHVVSMHTGVEILP